MTKQRDISTPEGHFLSLEEKLLRIPASAAPRTPSGIRQAAPYLAYAASLALLVGIGGTLVRHTAAPVAEESNWDYLSYLSEVLDADGMLREGESSSLSEEEIAQYLIEEGIHLETVNRYAYEEDR